MASLMGILQQAGFRGQALQIAYAIAMAESSGNAAAHNPNAGTGDNSYGLFQINMLGAMGPERRRQYGLKSNEDLFDPLTNAKIAFKMSNGGKNWGPWTTYTSGKYLKFMSGSDMQITSSGSGGYNTTSAAGGGTAPVTPKLDATELAEQYGLSAAVINSSPELKKIFGQAVAGSWSTPRFQAALRNTKWWATQSDSMRKYIYTKLSDPATWRQQSDAAGAKLNRIAVEVGLGNQMSGGKPSKLLTQAVYNSLALGWTDQRVKDWLGTQVGLHGEMMWGEAGDAFDKLHTVAYANGMKYSSSWYRDRAREVVSGKSTQSTVEDQIRRQAAARYTAYRDQILAGQNVMDLASPYLKTVATLLETPESDVDLFNKHVAKAMTSGATTPLWQFENDVRNDPLWRKTNNARESMFSTAHQVLNAFGVTY